MGIRFQAKREQLKSFKDFQKDRQDQLLVRTVLSVPYLCHICAYSCHTCVLDLMAHMCVPTLFERSSQPSHSSTAGRVQVSGFRVQGAECRVSGFGSHRHGIDHIRARLDSKSRDPDRHLRNPTLITILTSMVIRDKLLIHL